MSTAERVVVIGGGPAVAEKEASIQIVTARMAS